MAKELTDRQKAILDFITSFTNAQGYPPTLREIGSNFGISSTFGVKRHIDALVKKGFLNVEKNASRALKLVPSSGDMEQESNNAYEIPVVGRVAAGYPILAEENIEGKFVVDPSMVKIKKNCFGLKVQGDSMIKAGIFEGDLVIVNPQKEASSGEIIVALIDDEATLKRFMSDNDNVYLKPENDSYENIPVTGNEGFSIVGKVIGVFRFYN